MAKQKKKKTLTTWSGDDNSDNDKDSDNDQKTANLCFITIEYIEVTQNLEDLQENFDELLTDF